MNKQDAIKMIQENIKDDENIFISVWSFDVHPTWSADFTKADWDFAVRSMEGKYGEQTDEQIAVDLDWLMTAHREKGEKQ